LLGVQRREETVVRLRERCGGGGGGDLDRKEMLSAMELRGGPGLTTAVMLTGIVMLLYSAGTACAASEAGAFVVVVVVVAGRKAIMPAGSAIYSHLSSVSK
jgi:hypothetical protein